MRLTRESNLLKLDINLLKTSNKNKNLRKNQMKKNHRVACGYGVILDF